MALIIHNKAFDKSLHQYTIDDIISDSVKNKTIDDFILIVPTGKLNRHLKYQIINQYYDVNNSPCSKPNIHNLKSFAEQCFKLINSNSQSKLISSAFRLAVTQEAMKNAQLSFYNQKVEGNHNVVERISNIVYGLREDGINGEKMAYELSHSDPKVFGIKDAYKYSDICNILIEYEKLLSGKYIDSPALLKQLTAESNQYLMNNPLSNTTIFDKYLNPNNQIRQIMLYGFSEFKVPEVSFIAQFAQSSIPISIHLDFSEINGPLFGNLAEMKSTLLTAGYDYFYTNDEIEKTNSSPENELNAGAKDYLRRWLFNVEREIKYNGLNTVANVYEFDDIEQEVIQTAKIVKHLVNVDGYLASDIAIVSRNATAYSPLFRATFKSERIPANFSDRYNLSESQVATAVISILDTVAGGFKRIDVFKTLENLFIRIVNESGELLDRSNLLQSAQSLRLTQSNIPIGKKFWLTRFSKMVDFLENLGKEMDENNGSSLDQINITSKIKSFNRAYRDFESFADTLPEINSSYSADDFRALVVNGIIKRFAFADTIKEMYVAIQDKFSGTNRGYDYDVAIESIEKLSRALAELIRVVDEMTFILNDRPNTKYPINELINKLKISISGAKYQTREKQNYGVTVTSIEQIRHIPYKVTILCGMCDGVFPLPYRPESFLGKELQDSEQRHLQSEQIHFYQFLINGADYIPSGQKKIFLTYTKFQNNFEATRSSFIDSLLKVTNLEESGCVVKFSTTDAIELYPKYPWFDSISKRSEIAEIFGYESISSNNLTKELFDFSNPEALASDVRQVKQFTNKFYSKYSKLIDDKFALIEDHSKKRLNGMSQTIFSSSDFDTYASCSYKYFSKKLLKLQEKVEDNVLFSPLEFGNIMHNALYNLYLKLQSNQTGDWIRPTVNSEYNLPLLRAVNITTLDKREVILKFFECIEKEFADIRLDHPMVLAVKKEILGDEDSIGLAEIFIESEFERARIFQSYPILFEFEFGFPGDNKSIPDIRLENGIRLRGKIDRIEISGDSGYSTNSTDFQYTTVDYKSTASGLSTNKDIEKGLSFQMPLYSIAIKDILQKYYAIDASFKGGMYYIIKANADENIKSTTKPVLMAKSDIPKEISTRTGLDSNSQLLQIALQNSSDIVSKIMNAEFSNDPQKQIACRYCKFQPVCRIVDRRTIDFDNDENDFGEE